ncbi:MAG TPA: hypothetical protein VHL80_08805, partial [Polyangia bacterium]|nr:hypothetical protein [Polyangia bacterium]
MRMTTLLTLSVIVSVTACVSDPVKKTKPGTVDVMTGGGAGSVADPTGAAGAPADTSGVAGAAGVPADPTGAAGEGTADPTG